MGRRRASEAPNTAPPLCQRFEWVLRHRFVNSITLMATALGVPHASLSRVINQGQLPSALMIESLARLGLVNLDWLLAGAESDCPSAWERMGAVFAPVSTRLLVLPPSRTPALVGPHGLPTASPFRLSDPYWYRVPDRWPASAGSVAGSGDFLLVETGVNWASWPTVHPGRVLVLRPPEPGDGVLTVVGDEEYYADSPTYELDTFGVYPEATISDLTKPTDPATEKSGRSHRIGHRFHAADLCGVVLERRTLHGRWR